MHFGGQGFHGHRLTLIVGAVATGAYTLIVWWMCHPMVRQYVRSLRRSRRKPLRV